MRKTSFTPRFNFRQRVAYDPDAKQRFHREAQRQLKLLAKALGLVPGDFDLRSNLAGIAVSGEVTLHADAIYVQVSQPAFGGDTGILFRICRDRRDYVGGSNHFASLDLLNQPHELGHRIRAMQREPALSRVD